MDYKVKNKYPDFLMEFEDLEMLATVQEKLFLTVNERGQSHIKALRLTAFLLERWEGLVWYSGMYSIREYIKAMHRRSFVTSVEDYVEYAKIYLNEDTIRLSYDRDALKFHLVIIRSFSNAYKIK